MTIAPFSVVVGDDEIQDLRTRLARTRWPDQLPDTGWDYGTDRDYLQRLCAYWQHQYDWDRFTTRCNRHPQFLTEIGGQKLHFHHLRSPEPGAKPLLISHGWPGSVAEFFDIMGPLANPRAHGGDPEDAFHLVVPSLPGFGFSGPTTRTGFGAREIAATLDQLMRRLGYDRYFAQGGDWGALVTRLLAAAYPERVEAIHVTLLSVPIPNHSDPLAGLDAAEIAAVNDMKRFADHGTGYQKIQGTKPQSLAYGLTDSPAGLAGWIVEKFHGWSDCGGDLERHISHDDLLDNISIYWLTGTINSSMRLYYEEIGPGRFRPPPPVTQPTGYAAFPAEIRRTPRRWAERQYNIASWHDMPRGGHFAALEAPELLVPEIRRFFRDYR